ncbi:hypothetical protein RB195_017134 [Necator americanus]|uniref:Uncharacterized protein n=1 Tax=Necator americanus TaxID=51031 RepID=A0ABR1C3S1_NECAM
MMQSLEVLAFKEHSRQSESFTRTLTQLGKEGGSIAGSPANVAKVVEGFYSQLFSSTRLPAPVPSQTNCNSTRRGAANPSRRKRKRR